MNSRISEWASVAEILSGIAMVVTLMVLIVGVRENTEVTRASSYSRLMEGLTQYRFELISDRERIHRYLSYQQGDSLNDEERFEVYVLSLAVMGTYENAYYSHRYGVIGDTEWSRFDPQICYVWDYLRANDRSRVRERLTVEFAEYIDEICT